MCVRRYVSTVHIMYILYIYIRAHTHTNTMYIIKRISMTDSLFRTNYHLYYLYYQKTLKLTPSLSCQTLALQL